MHRRTGYTGKKLENFIATLPSVTEYDLAIETLGKLGNTSGDSRMTKLGGHCGVKEKSGGQHKCLSCMVIFRCNED